jgi:hypothetical protein
MTTAPSEPTLPYTPPPPETTVIITLTDGTKARARRVLYRHHGVKRRFSWRWKTHTSMTFQPTEVASWSPPTVPLGRGAL